MLNVDTYSGQSVMKKNHKELVILKAETNDLY